MQTKEKQPTFVIRKLTIGTASVLVGLSFFGLNAKTVHAAELNNTQKQTQTAQTQTQASNAPEQNSTQNSNDVVQTNKDNQTQINYQDNSGNTVAPSKNYDVDYQGYYKKASANVTYHDDTTNQDIANRQVSGYVGEKPNITDQYTQKGYDVVSNNQTRLSQDQNNNNYTVHLKHHIDSDVHSSITATNTINYVDNSGNKLRDSQQQSYDFQNRTDTDRVTGAITQHPMENSHTFKSVTNPVIDGYVTNSAKSIAATVTTTNKDAQTKIVYNKLGQFIMTDNNNNIIGTQTYQNDDFDASKVLDYAPTIDGWTLQTAFDHVQDPTKNTTLVYIKNVTPINPDNPNNPVQPTTPGNPTTPSQPEQQPGQSDKPNKGDQGGNGSTEPKNPNNPVQPSNPSKPNSGNQHNSGNINTPDTPNQPSNPSAPDEPNTPDQPDQKPGQPNTPDRPNNPDNPDKPSQPSKPAEPQTKPGDKVKPDDNKGTHDKTKDDNTKDGTISLIINAVDPDDRILINAATNKPYTQREDYKLQKGENDHNFNITFNPVVPGYITKNAENDDQVVTRKMGAKTLNVVYQKLGQYIIKSETGETLHDPITYTNDPTHPDKIIELDSAPIVYGYTLKNGSTLVNDPTKDTTLIYTKVPDSKITLNYYDNTTNTLITSDTLSGPRNQPSGAEERASAEIDQLESQGYKYSDSNMNFEPIFTKQDQTYTLHFTHNIKRSLKETQYTKRIIHFIDKLTGAKMAPDAVQKAEWKKYQTTDQVTGVTTTEHTWQVNTDESKYQHYGDTVYEAVHVPFFSGWRTDTSTVPEDDLPKKPTGRNANKEVTVYYTQNGHFKIHMIKCVLVYKGPIPSMDRYMFFEDTSHPLNNEELTYKNDKQEWQTFSGDIPVPGEGETDDKDGGKDDPQRMTDGKDITKTHKLNGGKSIAVLVPKKKQYVLHASEYQKHIVPKKIFTSYHTKVVKGNDDQVHEVNGTAYSTGWPFRHHSDSGLYTYVMDKDYASQNMDEYYRPYSVNGHKIYKNGDVGAGGSFGKVINFNPRAYNPTDYCGYDRPTNDGSPALKITQIAKDGSWSDPFKGKDDEITSEDKNADFTDGDSDVPIPPDNGEEDDDDNTDESSVDAAMQPRVMMARVNANSSIDENTPIMFYKVLVNGREVARDLTQDQIENYQIKVSSPIIEGYAPDQTNIVLSYSDPAQRTITVKYSKNSETPSTPNKPSKPSDSDHDNNDNPADPSKPDSPDTPDNPNKGNTSKPNHDHHNNKGGDGNTKPDDPNMPSQPDNPDHGDSDKPDKPTNPADLNKTDKPNKDNQGDQSDHDNTEPDNPNNPVQPSNPSKPNSGDQHNSGNTNTPGASDNPVIPVNPTQPDKPNNSNSNSAINKGVPNAPANSNTGNWTNPINPTVQVNKTNNNSQKSNTNNNMQNPQNTNIIHQAPAGNTAQNTNNINNSSYNNTEITGKTINLNGDSKHVSMQNFKHKERDIEHRIAQMQNENAGHINNAQNSLRKFNAGIYHDSAINANNTVIVPNNSNNNGNNAQSASDTDMSASSSSNEIVSVITPSAESTSYSSNNAVLNSNQAVQFANSAIINNTTLPQTGRENAKLAIPAIGLALVNTIGLISLTGARRKHA